MVENERVSTAEVDTGAEATVTIVASSTAPPPTARQQYIEKKRAQQELRRQEMHAALAARVNVTGSGGVGADTIHATSGGDEAGAGGADTTERTGATTSVTAISASVASTGA